MGKPSVFLVFGALINGIVSAPTDTTIATEFQKFAQIIDGTPINVTDYPFYANLDDNVCGGAIISERWVLTAAHCVYRDGYWKREGRIYVGGESIETSQLYYYDMSLPHISYFVNAPVGDIALLHVSEPLKFSNKVKPVQLPTKAYEEGPVNLVGRGLDETDLKTDYNAYNAKILSSDSSSDETDSSDSDYVDLHMETFESDSSETEEILLMRNKQKLNTIVNKSKVTKTVELYALPQWNDGCTRGGTGFCTIRKQGKPSSCPGDSGSPLVRGNTLIGITSSIFNPLRIRPPYACAFSTLTICTNVAYYLPWIHMIIER